MSGGQWVISQLVDKLIELGMTEQDLECLAWEITLDAVTKYKESEVSEYINMIKL